MKEVLTKYDKQWTLQYEKLVEFKRQNGHCIVLIEYEQDKSLGRWIRTQRDLRYHNKLTQDRKDKLDEIGFLWKVDCIAAHVCGDDKRWRQQYEKLVEFQRQHEHCRVPSKYKEDVTLGRWVDAQRRRTLQNTKKNLLPYRKELLNQIGFAWKVDLAVRHADSIAGRVFGDDKKWRQQYEKLVEFQRQHEHCRVPCKYKEDVSLGHWVRTQRDVCTHNKLTQDRKDKLDEIGFVWKVDRTTAARVIAEDKKWHQQYKRLVEFKRKNGHCIVPQGYEQEKYLGNWVASQRAFHTSNRLRQYRKYKLDEIGFVWKIDNLAARGCSSSTNDDVRYPVI